MNQPARNQTAVEWFNNEIKNLLDKHGFVSKKMLSIHFKRAKAMEREQIENARNEGYGQGWDEGANYVAGCVL